MHPSERFREALLARIEPAAPDAEARRIAAAIAPRGGPGCLAMVFFGSRKTRANPDPYSAYDFFVVTEDYRAFYESLKKAGALRRSPGLATALNAVLAPNQICLVDPEGGDLIKCSVMSPEDLLRATSERRKDHFTMGRLFQPTEIVYAATPEAARVAREAVLGAHVGTYGWVRPYLPGTFTVEAYARTLLHVSLGGEIRPESPARTGELFEAQKDYLVPVYAILLEDLARDGELRDLGGGAYALVRGAPRSERRRMDAYFRRSMVRATARWAKYMVTFEGWLDYIVRKAERRTGARIVLSPLERKYPLVFLWPRLFRFLREKDS
jgi:hypothetical protein